MRERRIVAKFPGNTYLEPRVAPVLPGVDANLSIMPIVPLSLVDNADVNEIFFAPLETLDTPRRYMIFLSLPGDTTIFY